jgi:hypothetical protein
MSGAFKMQAMEPMRGESPEVMVMSDYDRMCKESNDVPLLHNMLASFFSWILLAGFIISPGTFTKLRTAATSETDGSTAGRVVQAAVQNVPLIYVALVCSLAGTGGMYWLWRKWSRNYEWLLTHIFL